MTFPIFILLCSQFLTQNLVEQRGREASFTYCTEEQFFRCIFSRQTKIIIARLTRGSPKSNQTTRQIIQIQTTDK